MTVRDDEVLVRALHLPFWDSVNQRGTKSAFHQEEVSVSRVGILTYDEIVGVFKADLASVEATAEISAGDIRQASASPTNISDVVVEILAEPIKDDPKLTDNPAHAALKGKDRDTQLIVKRIPKGIANAILGKCVIKTL